MKKASETKTAFYGESTEKDAPVFLLAQALGVWGKPPIPPITPSPAPHKMQSDLFADM